MENGMTNMKTERKRFRLYPDCFRISRTKFRIIPHKIRNIPFLVYKNRRPQNPIPLQQGPAYKVSHGWRLLYAFLQIVG